jgi:hypothetical protein
MLAWKELKAANEPGALNIIVLWTDGAPNGITADFNNSSTPSLLAGSGCTNTNDGTNGQYPNAVAANSLLGWFAQWGNYAYNVSNSNGIRQRTQTTTSGMSVALWTTLTAGGKTGQNEPLVTNTGANGCNWGDGSSVSSVISIPTVDYYGNSTQGSDVAPYKYTDYQQSMIWNQPGTSGSPNCNQGVGSSVGNSSGGALTLSGTVAHDKNNNAISASANPCQIGLASWNAADMAARQIHGDTTLTPIIYTMGFAGNVTGSGGVDVALLERMANCVPGKACSPGGANATNTVYNSAIPSGMYIQIQTTNDVTPAFQMLLSEILRLSM